MKEAAHLHVCWDDAAGATGCADKLQDTGARCGGLHLSEGTPCALALGHGPDFVPTPAGTPCIVVKFFASSPLRHCTRFIQALDLPVDVHRLPRAVRIIGELDLVVVARDRGDRLLDGAL